MRGIKIPLHDFALKMQGGLMREGRGVFAGHYGIYISHGPHGNREQCLTCCLLYISWEMTSATIY